MKKTIYLLILTTMVSFASFSMKIKTKDGTYQSAKNLQKRYTFKYDFTRNTVMEIFKADIGVWKVIIRNVETKAQAKKIANKFHFTKITYK